MRSTLTKKDPSTVANENSETSPAMQAAIKLLKAGQTVKAEEVMVQAARSAEQEFGADGPETAIAYRLLTFSSAVGRIQAVCSTVEIEVFCLCLTHFLENFSNSYRANSPGEVTQVRMNCSWLH